LAADEVGEIWGKLRGRRLRRRRFRDFQADACGVANDREDLYLSLVTH